MLVEEFIFVISFGGKKGTLLLINLSKYVKYLYAYNSQWLI